jgi:CubicO group peptidase (beta-lactamase class C family)
MTRSRLEDVLPRTRAGRPGAAAIVTRNGETLFRGAYGLADIERNESLEPSMLFRIGSLTKQFTAAAILLLVDEGRLSLSDTASSVLDDFGSNGDRITIEHLLTHTSGLRNYTEMRKFPGVMASDASVKEIIDFFRSEPLTFAPGARFRYSNSGYVTLGAVIERLSGQTYADFIAQRIFIPLGMNDTSYEGHERSGAKRAEGYNRDRKAAALSMSWPYSAGGLVSTVDDLARWHDAICGKTLLSAESWRRATTPYKLPNGKSTRYGYGIFCGDIKGRSTLEHNGGINGFSSHAVSLPQENIFAAVLSNDDGMNILSLLSAIFTGNSPGGVAHKFVTRALDA